MFKPITYVGLLFVTGHQILSFAPNIANKHAWCKLFLIFFQNTALLQVWLCYEQIHFIRDSEPVSSWDGDDAMMLISILWITRSHILCQWLPLSIHTTGAARIHLIIRTIICILRSMKWGVEVIGKSSASNNNYIHSPVYQKNRNHRHCHPRLKIQPVCSLPYLYLDSCLPMPCNVGFRLQACRFQFQINFQLSLLLN